MAEKAIKNKDSVEGQEQKTFNPGDLAVYPAHGVGIIESIESREIGGEKMNFYIMKIIENNMVIMIPTKNVTSVGLRSVINKKDIKKVYGVIQKENDNSLDNQTWNRRHREYMEKIKTGSLYDVAEVFRDLFTLKFSKDLSFGERKLFDTAQGLLLKELCISTGKDEKNILSEIEALFETKN
ncbi:MAG: CarD family transcriptional regulator [Desulfobacterales bacterium]|nr:CarD family transcriptional regulator [Desulfobacterales bacterium]